MLARENVVELLFDRIGEGIIIVDVDGRIEDLNETAALILKTQKNIVTGMIFTEAVPNLDLIPCLQSRSFHQIQGKKVNINGHVVLVDCIPLYDRDSLSGAIVVLQDITEIKLMAEDLGQVTEDKLRLESFLDLLDEGIIVTDAWGKITSINRKLQLFLPGEKTTEIPGKSITSIFKEIDLKDGESISDVVLKSGGIGRKEKVINIHPLQFSGQIIGYVITLKKYENGAMGSRLGPDNISSENGVIRGAVHTLNDIVGQSKAIIQLKKLVKKISQTRSTVLLQSESGTGKELFANAIHNLSPRSKFPFVKLNCASLPESLLESELFGYNEGAFTGAKKGGYKGRFELAHGGTLFLDEVEEMPLTMQAKLLRVLEEQEIQRLGDEEVRKIDVRIICATNRDLWSLVEQKKFREDLFYRLSVVSLSIPPLRERREDIKPLVIYFIRKYSREFQKRVKGISPEVYSAFLNYEWPGNVRELKNTIEYAFNIVDGEIIELDHLPSHFISRKKQKYHGTKTLDRFLQECEREALVMALKNSGGNKVQAAKALGISRASLYRRLDRMQMKDIG